MAAVALALVNEAVLVVTAGVDQVLPDRPLEEAFAALTAVHPVVLPWGVKGRLSVGRQASALPSGMEEVKSTLKVEKTRLQGITPADLSWL